MLKFIRTLLLNFVSRQAISYVEKSFCRCDGRVPGVYASSQKMVPRFFGGTAKLNTRLAKEQGTMNKNIYQPTVGDKIKGLNAGSGLLQLLSTEALQAIPTH